MRMNRSVIESEIKTFLHKGRECRRMYEWKIGIITKQNLPAAGLSVTHIFYWTRELLVDSLIIANVEARILICHP